MSIASRCCVSCSLVAASLCVNTIVYLHMCVCAYERLLTHPQPHRHTRSCAYSTDTSTTPEFDTYTHSFLVWCVPFLLMCLACILPSQSRHALASTCLSSLDGYCSTVQGLLDWFEVDLGFTELLFI